MNAKHTPGPWEIRKPPGLTTVEIIDRDGVVVAEVGDTSLEDAANAALIAEAPELAGALWELAAMAGAFVQPGTPLDAAYRRAVVALGKVEGAGR